MSTDKKNKMAMGICPNCGGAHGLVDMVIDVEGNDQERHEEYDCPDCGASWTEVVVLSKKINIKVQE